MTRALLPRRGGLAGSPSHVDRPAGGRAAAEIPVVVDTRVTGVELLPISIELMAETEREGALDALATLYDTVGRPFQLLSVPAERDPD